MILLRKEKKYKNFIMFLATASIIVIQSLLFWQTWYIFYKFNIVAPFYEKGTLLLVLVYALLLATFTNIYGGYKVGFYRVSDIIYSQIISLIFVNIITYLQISLIARDMLNIIGIIKMSAIEIFIVILWAYVANKIYLNLNPAMKVLVVYGNKNIKRFIEKLSLRPDKYNICNVINIKNGIDNVFSEMEINNYDAVFIYDISSNNRNKIVKYCFDKSIRTYITPKISDIIVGSSDKFHLFDTPLLLCKNKGLTYEQSIAKRAIDIVGSVFLLILTSPVIILVAVSIKLYDGGSVIYKQERITLNNKRFHIYKFRSMVENAERDGIARLAIQDDERITLVGKFIRKVRFDELPQLFNVLNGDMSLVGPRPERPEIVEQYKEIMPEFDFRTKVKAGITGYAQVMGKYNTTPYDKLKLDLLYIENFSFVLDFKLMLMTIKVLFMPESTEGLNKDEVLPGEILYNKKERAK